MKLQILWLSSERITIFAEIIDGVVHDTAPVAHRFIGQPFLNLRSWMEKQKWYREEDIT